MNLPNIVSAEPFVPHSYQHILDKKVFPPGALPEPAYAKMLKDYEAMEGLEVLRIVYLNDGLKITGLAVLPKDWNEGGHPVMLYNRGGSGEYGKLTVLSVLRSMAPFAKKGMLVFASNYRGNDGGEGHDEFGGDDVGDVLALLNIAKKHPGFDGKNSYILGHSRGAMMTMMSLREEPSINAAIALAGVSDVYDWAEASPDMRNTVFKRFMPKEPEDEAFMRRSAYRWAEDIHVPVLLMHGDADEVVTANQSIKLAEALEAAEKKHALHIIKGGNHALYRHWDDVLTRSHNWIEEHRK